MIRRPAPSRDASPSAVVGGVAAVVDVLRGGPEQHVAVHGGRDQHALALRGRHRQQDRVQQRPRQLVEHDELAAAGPDREAGPAEHGVDAVAVQAGRVDQPAGAERAAAGRQHVIGVARRLESGDPGPQHQPDPGAHRLGGVGQRRGPRADDALVRDLERGQRARPEVRFPPVQSVPGHGADPGVPVLSRLFCDRRERLFLLGGPGHEQRAGALDAVCRPAPRSRAAACCRGAAGGSPGCRAPRRTPCAGSRCSPWWCRCPRRWPHPAGRR